MKDKYIIGAVIIALVLSGAAFFSDGVPGRDGTDGRDGVGAQSGPDRFDHIVFRQNFTSGGDVLATTSTDSLTAYTLLSSEINEKVGYVSWNNGRNITITTMASTSRPLVGLRVGETYTLLWFNASTTAGSVITFAAGSGVDLQEDEGETVLLNGLEVARLTFTKKADTDVILWVELGQVGD